MNLMFAMLPLLGALIIPFNGLTLRGSAVPGSAADLIACADSIVDLSHIPAQGRDVEWSYIVPADTSIIELRENYWHRYSWHGDTLLLNHTESSRERSDFNLVLSANGSAPVSQPFKAGGRRDMAFVYDDDGSAELERRFPVTLVLAPGDTVTNVLATTRTLSYTRHRVNHRSPSGNIVETETLWSLPGSMIPLAVATARTVKVQGHDTVKVGQTVVFPRLLNPDANPDPENTKARSILTGSSNNFPGIATHVAVIEPSLSYDAPSRTITASGAGPVSILVCDIQGRVLIERTAQHSQLEVALGSLSPGEYVITLITPSGMTGRTISLRR